MSTLRERIEGLIANWRKATKGISADGFERPLEWEGKDILRLCADELAAALVAEGQETAPESVREEIRNALICDQTTGAGDYDEAVGYAERIVGKAAKNDLENPQDQSRPGLFLDAIDWWHRRWHQDTGIPCDGISEYCPLTKWKSRAAAPSLHKEGVRERFVSDEEYVAGIADEASESCVDWSNGVERQKGLRWLAEQVRQHCGAALHKEGAGGELRCPICGKELSGGISWCKTCDVTHAVSCVECHPCGYINTGPCELGKGQQVRDAIRREALEEAVNIAATTSVKALGEGAIRIRIANAIRALASPAGRAEQEEKP